MTLQGKYSPEIRKIITKGWDFRNKQMAAKRRWKEYGEKLKEIKNQLQQSGIQTPDSWNKKQELKK